MPNRTRWKGAFLEVFLLGPLGGARGSRRCDVHFRAASARSLHDHGPRPGRAIELKWQALRACHMTRSLRVAGFERGANGWL